jgi:VWFA-related protein
MKRSKLCLSVLLQVLEESFMLLARIGIRLAVLTIGVFTIAQEQPAFKVDVDVVNVLATVRDRGGRIISDLTKDDFILEENGQKQEIRYFSHQADLPLRLGLLVDTSQSQRNLIDDERSASYLFFNQVLRPDRDQAFVIKFDIEAELLQDLTQSIRTLQKTLNELKTPSMQRRSSTQDGRWNPPGDSLTQIWPPGGQMPGGQRRSGRGGQQGQWPGTTGIGTVLYDAVFLASDEILRQQEGRKAIILISDGVDAGSKVSEREAIEAAHRADTIVYCIRYYDSTAYGGRGIMGTIGREEDFKGTAALQLLSKETGGRQFEVSKKLPLKEIYEKIQEELRNQYSLGYTLPPAGNSEFRHIKLRTKDSKFEVVTRAGYYPKK